MLNIREIKPEDIKSCIEIFNANAADMGDLYTEESLLAASKHHPYFVAEEGGQILGVIGVTDLENGIAMLISLSVSPKAQGKGVGRQLVQKVKEYAEKENFRKVLLLTHEKNKKMMKLNFALNLQKINSIIP